MRSSSAWILSSVARSDSWVGKSEAFRLAVSKLVGSTVTLLSKLWPGATEEAGDPSVMTLYVTSASASGLPPPCG